MTHVPRLVVRTSKDILVNFVRLLTRAGGPSGLSLHHYTLVYEMQAICCSQFLASCVLLLWLSSISVWGMWQQAFVSQALLTLVALL